MSCPFFLRPPPDNNRSLHLSRSTNTYLLPSPSPSPVSTARVGPHGQVLLPCLPPALPLSLPSSSSRPCRLQTRSPFRRSVSILRAHGRLGAARVARLLARTTPARLPVLSRASLSLTSCINWSNILSPYPVRHSHDRFYSLVLAATMSATPAVLPSPVAQHASPLSIPSVIPSGSPLPSGSPAVSLPSSSHSASSVITEDEEVRSDFASFACSLAL